MSFSLSGSLITQTGTDANLSGLSGVAGVITSTNGSKTVYNIGNNRLTVGGTLTFDPRVEELQLGAGITAFPQLLVDTAGTLNIGSDISLNGTSFAPPCTAIVIPSFSAANSGGSNEDSLYAAFRVAGVCNHYFGTVFLRGPIGFGTSLTQGTYRSYSRNAAFVSLGTAGSNSTEIQIRQRSANNQFNGITTQGIWWTLMGNPTLMKGAAPYHGVFAFAGSSSSSSQTWIAVRDYPGALGNSYDVSHRLPTVWTRFINSGVGTALKSAGNDASSGTPNNCGLQELRQELNVAARSVTGAVISTGGIYLFDCDNGNRCPFNTSFFGAAQPNYTLDREYPITFNGAGIASVVADGGILIGVNWRNTGGLRDSNNQQDFRGEENAATDQWVIRCRSYGKVFSDVTVVLRGVGGTTQGVTLFDNPDITQSSATAAAHTGISLVDHGASPVSWNGKNFSITITANRTVNPSLTAADIYHYLQYHLANVTTTFNGKMGGAWHNMMRVEGSGFATVVGDYTGLRVTKGVRVIDEAGNPFAGVVRMQSNDGSYYVPPIQYQLQISNLVIGSDVVILSAGTSTILDAVDQVTGTTYSYIYSAPSVVDIGVLIPGYIPLYIRNYSLPLADSVLPVSQVIDRSYQ